MGVHGCLIIFFDFLDVHTVLHDLLPPKVYFRFNPYMSEEFHLDENRSEKWQIMQHDTQMYVRRNDHKFEMASRQMLKTKTPLQKINGFIKQKLNVASKY
jgi:calcium-independent phospholipase A2-gamma